VNGRGGRMKNRYVLEVVTIAPREAQQFTRGYDSNSRTSWEYSIDAPEDVRQKVNIKKTKTGTKESGLEFITIHNWSFTPVVVTFFDYAK
jgi:hypothetical protein